MHILAAASLFPAHLNDEPSRHHDGHHEYAHSKSLRNLCDVEAAHGRSLVGRRQPHQARERPRCCLPPACPSTLPGGNMLMNTGGTMPAIDLTNRGYRRWTIRTLLTTAVW